MTSPSRLTLLSKPGCHLCEQMRELVDELQPDYGYLIEELDITRTDVLHGRYRHAIPVVLMNGREIARGPVEKRALVAAIDAAMTSES